ncbi:MAG TPA: hypothetical protein VFH77_03775 [Streptomyces sp.]|jgi:hypothetical protein|nr:hypothetical protein [Streptomyces sp.]
MTVHGETAIVPAIGKAEARKVLETFQAKNNEANKTYSVQVNRTIEAGALGAIDQAGLKARHAVYGGKAKNFAPLSLSDPRFLIPEQAGWPKSFVADVKAEREGKQSDSEVRWLLVFQRNAIDDPWKAVYLAVVSPSEMPQFATESDGHVKDVPLDEGRSGLTIAPGRLSKAYTTYLGKRAGEKFADADATSGLLASRAKEQQQERVRTEYADLPAEPPQFTPFALRTKDGGAVVFFASHHQTKRTLPSGYTVEVSNPLVKALMSGTPEHSVTYVRIAQDTVKVPAADQGGQITFIDQIMDLTRAEGS